VPDLINQALVGQLPSHAALCETRKEALCS
jgi:hypothetical protein